MAQRASGGIRGDRFLLGIVIGSIALVLVGIAAVILVGRSRPAQAFAPNSPGEAVQTYVEAIRSDDRDRAYDLLGRSARASVSRETYSQRFSSYTESSDRQARIVTFTSAESIDSAEVKVTISRFSARSEPFSAGTSHRNVTVRLVREDGVWRISQPTEPYSFVY